MKAQKTIFQGLLFFAIGVALWFGLSQFDFMSLFSVTENKGKTEEKLGELIWESIEKTETIIHDDSVVKPMDKLFTHICKANDINPKSIKVHIVEKDEINAFALPAGHLIVYTGLLQDCNNESELAGVIGHEIAHIEKDHVMKKLVKELGLAVIVSMTTGGKGGGMVHEALKTLSSSAYDRSLESEADMTSVDYLEKANLNPAKFADFMYNMSRQTNLPNAVYYISTHPESEERALAILDKIKGEKFKVKKILTDTEWKSLTNP
ncbi:M48 family metallopeptidase [Flavobacterium silvaticum]|uniref:M48 family metallopeptidase n=1 Tax=Flavobacterium silvaticum TaxID=1852020 RepID=A0A972JII2_9FLAO|nr:M48 family metallopeptidase [Flavobacterium silvaticum]NMH28273.1 M48 family metallopeptidase [Flavobacterium silvaticum]